jgi:hypothetical protein
MVSRFLPLSQISGRITIPLFQISVLCEKCVAALHYSVINYSLQIIETGFAEQFYASHRMGPAVLHQYVGKFPRLQLKARPIE